MRLEDAIAFVGGNYGPSTGQLINFIFRCILNFGSALACWVPMRLFYKNGELAGTTMVIAIAILNFYYFINTLMWPNDDIANWPKGYGWCDIQLASWVPVETLNAAAVCAILHNVFNQVSVMRASGLSGNEKRRKHLIQALIIFPIPVLQFILYYFIIAIRYNISGIIGCQAVFDGDWVFLVFYLLPCPVFAAIAAYFAALIWWRYRQIDATSRQAFWNSGNSSAQARNARTRQKLYFMTLTIIAPYFPLQMAFMYSNIHQGMPWSKPYNLSRLHSPGWANVIDYSPSTRVPFTSMYVNYVAVIEVIIFYLYFGRTKDAHDMYRKYLRALGLGKIFPKLNEEWFPSERPPASLGSLWSRAKSLPTFVSSMHSSSSSGSKEKTRVTVRPLNDVDDIQLLNIRLDSLDLEAARSTPDTAPSSNGESQHFKRSPWIFRTTLSQHYPLPKIHIPAIFSKDKNRGMSKPSSQSSLKPVIHPLHSSRARSPGRYYQANPLEEGGRRMAWDPSPSNGHVHTRVWASDSHGSTLVEDTKSGGRDCMGGVKIERHISSSSEISFPQPAYL
ncbi:Pheromone a factor receptor [Cytospora mali]|uniref:Pheromone a factor receptor n=1 Tax=Cytospora mali TaxID=578113 RepID=A0A194VN46_CYTMA|nr:Pheromone a factor receptor [Valsa mali]